MACGIGHGRGPARHITCDGRDALCVSGSAYEAEGARPRRSASARACAPLGTRVGVPYRYGASM